MTVSPKARLSQEIARERAERAAEVLAADPRVRLVFLFGSAADPDRPSVGDVDLAILTEPPLELDELMRLRDDLVDAAGPAIDLVALNAAPVVLAYEVATGGSSLFSREEGHDTDFVVRAILRYLDFKHYFDQQWQIAGERLEERQRGLAR